MVINSDKTKTFLICLILILATIAVYYQVYSFSFVNYDDAEYVHQNPFIKNGITLATIKWAFTTGYACFWHPVTWLSHALDWQMFENNPAGHHITSLVFHIFNTVLLFLVLKQMTNALWPSAFAAALFALHPLHVESVAWISERKDVLSTFFWILTMWAYTRYARQPKFINYLLMLIFFAFGLMSKPMLVTLPFVLLLLDYWPLQRMADNNPQHKVGGLSVLWRLVIEKIPLFVMVAASSIAAYIAQKQGKAIPTGENFAFVIRIANASISYIQYIIMMFWPAKMAMFYPHPGKDISYLNALISAAILIALTILVICFSKKHKYLFVGWFWYIGTLVPVIGIIQVGNHAMADRYTYITLTGLFIIIAWGVPEILVKIPHRKILLWILSLAVLTSLGISAHIQTGYWKDSIKLCEHALEVTENNYRAHFCISLPLIELGRIEESIEHSNEAIRINPQCYEAYNNLGVALCQLGRFDEAILTYQEVIERKPGFAVSHGNLASIFLSQGAYIDAIEHCNIALETLDTVPTRKTLAKALLKLGRYEEAIDEYRRVLSAAPDDSYAQSKLGYALARSGKFDEAINTSIKALEKDPKLNEPHLNLGFALIGKGQFAQAQKEYEIFLAAEPNDAIARSEFGIALFRQGKLDEAVENFNKALQIDPNNTAIKENLNFALAEKEKLQKEATDDSE